jgi:hypothetical protein
MNSGPAAAASLSTACCSCRADIITLSFLFCVWASGGSCSMRLAEASQVAGIDGAPAALSAAGVPGKAQLPVTAVASASSVSSRPSPVTHSRPPSLPGSGRTSRTLQAGMHSVWWRTAPSCKPGTGLDHQALSCIQWCHSAGTLTLQLTAAREGSSARGLSVGAKTSQALNRVAPLEDTASAETLDACTCSWAEGSLRLPAGPQAQANCRMHLFMPYRSHFQLQPCAAC